MMSSLFFGEGSSLFCAASEIAVGRLGGDMTQAAAAAPARKDATRENP
jgi:hypothetical protein